MMIIYILQKLEKSQEGSKSTFAYLFTKKKKNEELKKNTKAGLHTNILEIRWKKLLEMLPRLYLNIRSTEEKTVTFLKWYSLSNSTIA